MIMKKISLILILFASALNIKAQDITGDWYGAINAAGAKLHLVFHISQTGDVYATTFDSPDQHAKDLGTDKTSFTGNALTIEANKFGIKYTGTYKPDSSMINGTFTQGALNLPLILTRKQAENNQGSIKRPQDPKDFPYKQEEVAFDDPKGGDRLAGTLRMPADGKLSKIVILITGSGPENRDEEIFNHRPFLVLSDWLTRHGIAVLRYDDRGVAKSTGNFNMATTADFADDAEAAVAYIQSRADLKNLSIGLMGHSEGGTIAPMVASRNKAVKFMVLLAGPGVTGMQLMLKQTAEMMNGAPAAAIERGVDRNKKMYGLLIQNPTLSTAKLQQLIQATLYDDMRAHPGFGVDSTNIKTVIQAYAPLLSPWFRYVITINPADYLTKVKCPVLALDGTLDMQVNAEANLAGIKASLEKAGNKNFEIVALPGLNHLFQKATTGAVSEYEQIDETIDPVVLDKVTAWINKL
jgi:alpha/beta superfamily hydrolase